MSASLTITKVTFGTIPTGNVTATISYRECLSGDPYTIVTTGAVVLPNGNLQVPVVIPALTENQCYEVKIVNNCDGNGVSKNLTTASVTCPGVVAMDTTTEIEAL